MIDQTAHRATRQGTATILNIATGRPDPVATSSGATHAGGHESTSRRAASRLDRVCNLTILMIIAFPFVLAAIALARRLAGL